MTITKIDYNQIKKKIKEIINAKAKDSTCYIALYSDIKVYKLADPADFGTPQIKTFS